jgi:hypothetical protein
MSKAAESLLRGAREALDYARGAREGFVTHAPDRKAFFVEELTGADLEGISRAEVPAEHDHLDKEYED